MDMRGLIHSRSAWYGKTGPVSYKVMRLISSLGGGTKIEGIRRGSETETSVFETSSETEGLMDMVIRSSPE